LRRGAARYPVGAGGLAGILETDSSRRLFRRVILSIDPATF
jgi:hypothetical protein